MAGEWLSDRFGELIAKSRLAIGDGYSRQNDELAATG